MAVAPPPIGNDPLGQHDQITRVLLAIHRQPAEAVALQASHTIRLPGPDTINHDRRVASPCVGAYRLIHEEGATTLSTVTHAIVGGLAVRLLARSRVAGRMKRPCRRCAPA